MLRRRKLNHAKILAWLNVKRPQVRYGDPAEPTNADRLRPHALPRMPTFSHQRSRNPGGKDPVRIDRSLSTTSHLRFTPMGAKHANEGGTDSHGGE